jgi:hypothetical protein
MLLEIRLLAISATVCTDAVKWFSMAHRVLYRKSKNPGGDLGKFVALLVSFPIFQASHFFFKIAYRINQRRLRLLRGEDFFLKFYNRRVAKSSVTDILESLRDIKSGLDGAESGEYFSNHAVSSTSEKRAPSA